MIDAIFMLGGLGIVVGAGLAVASKVFYVYVDPRITAVESTLPGANCGGCGVPGCGANAEAIVAGKAAPDSCVAAGPEVAEAIAALLGVSVEAKEPDVARPGCTYSVEAADTKYIYTGLSDCRAATLLNGGMKVCNIGCLGLGSCVKVCKFSALRMGAEGLPVVNEDRCTGCGACERVCPKHIITLSSVTRRIMREYTTEDCTTPCQRACPAGIDICEYIGQIQKGNPTRAVQVIKERNPFPTVIGRICPRPCENECRRQYVDEPVAINFLKRYAADYEKQQKKRIQPFKAPATNRSVAIVGGGVEGLSAAFFSARLGHSPVVYEATDRLGGLLRTAIDRHRLPSEILDWDIEGILDMGVAVEMHKTLGRDITVNQLLAQGYEAVLLASGGWDSRLVRGAKTPEQPIPGTLLLVELAQMLQKGVKAALGGNVVILGGAEGALEAARQCMAAGSQVHVLYRSRPADSGLSEAAIAQAREAGIQLHFDTVLTGLSGQGRQLTAVEIMTTADGAIETLAVSHLVLAAGRFPELIFLPVPPEIEEGAEVPPVTEKSAWRAVAPYKKPESHQQPGLFAPADELSDFSGAIRAIAAGRRAAASIHRIIYDLPLELPQKVLTPLTIVQDVDAVHAVKNYQRRIMPMATPQELPQVGEIEKGFSAETASQEAARCLQCGLICYRHAGNLKPIR